MSLMSFVTSFVGAFVTSAVVSRPKMVEECKDDEIRKLKVEVAWLRDANHKLAHSLADERDRTIELNQQLAAAELASFTWRARAEMVNAFYDGVQLMVGNPVQLEEQIRQQQQTVEQLAAQTNPQLVAWAQAHTRHIRNCCPSRAELLVPQFFRGRL